jgi:hypothetical protein
MSAVSNFFRDLFGGGGKSTMSSSSGGSNKPAATTTKPATTKPAATTTKPKDTIGSVSPQGTYAGDGFEWRDTGSGYLTRTYTGTNRGLGLGSEPIQAGGSDKPVKETIAQISLNEGSSYAYSPQSATDKSLVSLMRRRLGPRHRLGRRLHRLHRPKRPIFRVLGAFLRLFLMLARLLGQVKRLPTRVEPTRRLLRSPGRTLRGLQRAFKRWFRVMIGRLRALIRALERRL